MTSKNNQLNGGVRRGEVVCVLAATNVGRSVIPRNTGSAVTVMMTPKEAHMEEVRRKIEEQVRKDCIHSKALAAYKDIKV